MVPELTSAGTRRVAGGFEKGRGRTTSYGAVAIARVGPVGPGQWQKEQEETNVRDTLDAGSTTGLDV